MKRHLTLALLCALVTLGFGQPRITEVTFPKSAEIFGMYEISFNMGSYANPYDPEVIDVYAEFVGPNGKSFKVNGFYYEGYTFEKHKDYEKATADRNNGWRVRFTPDQVGTWTFTFHAIDRKGQVQMTLAFTF